MKSSIVAVLLFISFASGAADICKIMASRTTLAPAQNDGLYVVLSLAHKCPQDVVALQEIIHEQGLLMSSYMVANRGRLNPDLGSFSFFEVAQGLLSNGQSTEIFMGHFTHVMNGVIELDQEPTAGKLLIEAIAFDDKKGVYNFYELIGSGKGATWFYRGDSQDALLDNTYLYREPPPGQDKFGKRMRCSACHTSGGPIMKELAPPHNDWWMGEHQLPFGNNALSPSVLAKVGGLQSATGLAQSVRNGMNKLYESPSYQKISHARSLQEIVRPLFCTTEINLASSATRLKDESQEFLVPSTFLLHPLLGMPALRFQKKDYQGLLRKYRLSFPETTEMDADHMWLAPVVGTADIKAVDNLIASGLVSQKAAIDILMIDALKPIFSQARCGLLAAVPKKYSPDWLAIFRKNLQRMNTPDAQRLIKNLENPDSYSTIHEPALKALMESMGSKDSLEPLFKELITSRKEVFSSDISKNPKGQILEPGFRVIFPEVAN